MLEDFLDNEDYFRITKERLKELDMCESCALKVLEFEKMYRNEYKEALISNGMSEISIVLLFAETNFPYYGAQGPTQMFYILEKIFDFIGNNKVTVDELKSKLEGFRIAMQDQILKNFVQMSSKLLDENNNVLIKGYEEKPCNE